MSESLGAQVLDSLLEPIMVLDENGIITSVNAAWQHLAWRNGAADEVASPLGLNYLAICEHAAATTNDPEAQLAADGIRAVQNGSRSEFHHEYACHSPYEQRWFRMTVTRLRGSPSQVVVSHRNVSDLKRVEVATKLAQSMLRHVAEENPITGLPNRATLLQRLEKLVERNRTEVDFCFAVLFVQLDRLALINDALGYLAGEELVSAVGQRLRDAAARGAFVAQFGDGEFVYVATGVDSSEDASALAERLKVALSAPYVIQAQELQSSVSIGIALWDLDACDSYELLRNGAIALNEARHVGPGAVALFDQTMHDRRSRRLSVEMALRSSLQKGLFTVVYQPIVDVRSGRMLAADALLRWHHPELGSVTPAEFIPIAEQTGLIVPIGDWVLCESCVQWTRWQQRGRAAAPGVLSINLSPVQIATGAQLLDAIRWALEFARMPADALQIGIAERDLLEERAGARDLAFGLRDLGVRLAVTDVGMNALSLACLRDHPAYSIKLPKSLMAGIGRDEQVLAMARSTIRIIESIGLTTVAEGVDDATAFATLETVGCRAGQGMLLARPVTADALLRTPIALPVQRAVRSAPDEDYDASGSRL